MPRSNRYTFTDDEFTNAVKTSYSIAEVLRQLGLSAFGAGYRTFKIRVKNLGLDISHFTGQGHSKGKTQRKRLPIECLLVETDNKALNQSFKKRLLESGLIENKCNICGLKEIWQDKPIILHIDHINGNPFDHRIENLRLLCPNCHSQTDTYCSKNRFGRSSRKAKAENKEKRIKPKVIYLCVKCNQPRRPSKAKYCGTCYNSNRKELQTYKGKTKIVWPPLNELLKMLSNSNYVQVAKQLDISDNAIRKHIKKLQSAVA